MAENTASAFTDNASSPSAHPRAVVEKRSSAPTILIVVILSLAVGGGAAWFVFQSRAFGSKDTGIVLATPEVFHLEGFTVNLADPAEDHFVRVTMDLELDRMPKPPDKDRPAGGLPMARIRDTIITVLASCKADALLTSDGKNQLKKQLREALDRRVPEIDVRDIYFTEFLVQR